MYQLVSRPTLTKYGIWDQMRMYYLKNFALFSCKSCFQFKDKTRDEKLLKKQLHKNYVVEWLWPEFNTSVNYPM